MVVVTLINRLRSIQSLSLLMTSGVMGNKMGVCNSLLLGLCAEEAAPAVVKASQMLLTAWNLDRTSSVKNSANPTLKVSKGFCFRFFSVSHFML